MDFNAMAYPDTFIINGESFRGTRNSKEKKVLIPYTNAPDVIIGQNIIQSVGKNEINLKVTDMRMLPGGTLRQGTDHPNMLTLYVENITENEHMTPPKSNTFNIGSITGDQVQIR